MLRAKISKSHACRFCLLRSSACSKAAFPPHKTRMLCFYHKFLKSLWYCQISHFIGIQFQATLSSMLRTVHWWLFLNVRLINGSLTFTTSYCIIGEKVPSLKQISKYLQSRNINSCLNSRNNHRAVSHPNLTPPQ